jgi:hypothetical protein
MPIRSSWWCRSEIIKALLEMKMALKNPPKRFLQDHVATLNPYGKSSQWFKSLISKTS